MVDDARCHEQRRLEDGVVDHVEDRCNSSKRTAKAQQGGNKPKIADGWISQQTFEVLLEYRKEAADQQGCQAGKTQNPEPFFGARKYWPQAREQEDTRFHHRCRMKIGGHRRRRCHRIG